VRRLGLLIAALALPAAGLYACDSERAPPTSPPAPTSTATGTDFDAGLPDGPPGLDAPGLCGNELHATGYVGPNLYFVLDRSGSMIVVEGSNDSSRYELVRGAALELIRTLGPLINVGAALFPKGNIEEEPCDPGDEVLSTRPGDPVTGEDGETTQAFRYQTNVTPKGGTPVAGTLRDLAPTLAALPGKTVVLLATDGAPNCNANASCGPEECIAYLEGDCPSDPECCSPGGIAGPSLCIDRGPTVSAVGALHALDIDVYVVGIPGSALYGEVLDEMAVAGGTAADGAPKYVRVDDLGKLAEAFAEIAAQAISCEFPLTDPPTETDMTNVYLDGAVVPYDEVDGWTWSGGDNVVLHGEACEMLKTGGATTVQVVTGCPTEYPR
jgi:hypothetical protein